ncbi:MAG: tetratricopeptide repeat protein [Deltaproteobacteria bacterium]|nr:tetratricopeptide repeat protein [Deltaproteobacteria bacterium]MBN2670675.1 tetratricopeptide repeat protein [Deltaproteobacteria bacterium]
MMEFSEKQERMSCQEASLLIEKTIVDERLSVQERNAVQRHLDECERCRNTHRLMNALPLFAEAAAEGEFDKEISTVVAQLQQERARARKHNARLLAVGVAAALAAVLLIGVWRWGAPDQIEEASVATGVFPCEVSNTVDLVPGVQMTYCEGREPGTLIQDGAVQVSLEQGIAALSVDPHRRDKKSVSVKTPGGEVWVKGTLFAVYVNQSDERVEVFRGIVEVIPHREEKSAFPVAAGHGGRLALNEVYPLTDPLTAELVAALNVGAEDDTDAEQLTDATESNKATQKTGADNEAVAVAEEDAGEGTDAAVNTAEPGRRAAKSMESLIEDARSCLLSHDWECAATNYQKVLKLYSRHPESSAVYISLAKIELRHLRSPRQALSHYNAYLKKAPNGPLAEEALLGTAKSYQQLGQVESEKQALRQFLARFPNSSLVGKAKARLAEL